MISSAAAAVTKLRARFSMAFLTILTLARGQEGQESRRVQTLLHLSPAWIPAPHCQKVAPPAAPPFVRAVHATDAVVATKVPAPCLTSLLSTT